MQLQQILALMTEINEKYNLILANAKTIDELEEQLDLLANSFVAVRVGGVTQKLQVQKIIDAVQTYAVNEMVSVGTIIVDGNDVTIPAGAQWRINGVNLFSSEPTVINIPFAATGKIRTDIVVANSGGNIVKVTGTETDTGEIAVRPPIPFNSVLVTQINVTDASFDTIVETIGEAPIDGNMYGRKDGAWEQITGDGTPPDLQTVVTQGGVVISTDGLKKVEIDKDNGRIKISTRDTTDGEWFERSIIQGNAFAQSSADGTSTSQLLHYALTFQNPNNGINTEYRYDRIVNALNDGNAVDSLLPTATDTTFSAQKLALKPILNSEDFTAELGVDYETDVDLTVTDPDDQIGSYRVFVSNNTATIGGVAYPKGSRIYRYYDGTAWNTIQLIDKDYVDAEINNAVAGLLDDRGNHDASSNLFPSTGGSGSGGAIVKGDLWTISVAGTLGGVAVTVGDVIRALVDTPGQTSSNWVVTENNLGYVPENNANKTDVMSGNTTSSTKFLSAKGVYDWVTSILVSATSSVAGIAKLYTGLGSNTDGSMTQKAISDELAKKVSFWSSGLDGIPVSNTLTISATYSQLIPANTFGAGDVILIKNRVFAPAAKTSASNIFLLINTLDQVAGATQLGQTSAGVGGRGIFWKRAISIKGGTSKILFITATNSVDEALGTALSTVSIDWTVDQYIIFAIGHTANDQTLTGDFYLIEKK